MQDMTLDEKIGQIMVIGFDGTEADPALLEMITDNHVGGVVLFARNIESPEQVARLTNSLQKAAVESGHPGLLIAIDQEGGRVARLTENKGFTEFPGAMAVAATGEVNSARRVAEAMAAELRVVGINMDFAPDLDVNNNPNNPVIGLRSFGSQPEPVAEYGTTFIQGLQESGILAVGKHFPGHGDTGTDSHYALPIIPHDRARFDAVELVPFRAAVQANVAGIMSAHVTVPEIENTNGVPATLSNIVLTRLLRQELGFKGMTITDSLEMGALGEAGYPAPKAAAAALRAGADVLLFNRDHAMHKQAIERIKKSIEAGSITKERLDDAVKRVLAAKTVYKILQPTYVDEKAIGGKVGTPETQSLSREIARRSITLLLDQNNLLPLSSGEAYLVIEPPWAAGLGRILGIDAATASEEPAGDEIAKIISQLQRKSVKAAVIATSDANRNPRQTALVQSVVEEGIPVITVAIRNPYDIIAYPEVSAYLVTYGANPPAFEALADIMWGRIQPSGRIPVEIPGLFAAGDGIQQLTIP